MCIKSAENVEDAFEMLLETFSTPRLLWQKKKEDISEAFGKRNVWGPDDSTKRRNAIVKMINHLEEAKLMSKQDEKLKSWIY